jgi:drug/metabolite transporter (DMT)-like permease
METTTMADQAMVLCGAIAWGVIMMYLTILRLIAKGEVHGWPALVWAIFATAGFMLVGTSYYSLVTSGHTKLAFWTAFVLLAGSGWALYAEYRHKMRAERQAT